MQRERLGSRLGFILLSAGCAIGIGNVWKFPYMVGQNGGGAFVLIYLFFLLVLGIPVMTIEFSLGRASQKSPVRLYQQLEPKGSKWHYHGYVALSGNYLLMMFYTTVGGWMIQYFLNAIALLILSLPCALGFNLLSGIHPLGGSSNFLDLEDFLVSNIILPVGSLIFLLFAVSKRGWGWENFMAEANAGRGLKVKNWMRGYMTYILPFLFLGIFLIGLVTYFQ